VGEINHAETAGVARDTIAGVPSTTNAKAIHFADLDTDMGHKYGTHNRRDGLRPRKPRDYSHLHADLEHTAFTQYNVRKGLKIFGEAGAQTVG
jgi:hypothetical protein